MTKVQISFSTLHKKINASSVSFIFGLVIALLVNYLSGNGSPHAVYIIVLGSICSITTGLIWFMRRRTDSLYEKLLIDPDTLNDAAWDKASGPTQPGKASKFFAYIAISTITLFAFLIFLIIDNFMLPSERDKTENRILEKLDNIQHSISLVQNQNTDF